MASRRDITLDFEDGDDGYGSVANHDADLAVGRHTPTPDDFAHPAPAYHSRDSAYYDYTSDKSLSHADSKLFYQRHRIEQQASADNTNPLERVTSFPLGAVSEGLRKVTLQPKPGEVGFDRRASSPLNDKLLTQKDGTHSHKLEVKTAPSHRIDSSNAIRESPDQDSLAQAQAAYRSYDPARVSEPNIAVEAADTNAAASINSLVGSDLAITSELSLIYTNIQKILDLRHKYMRLSLQEQGANPKDEPSWNIYPPPPEPAWNQKNQHISPLHADPTSVVDSPTPTWPGSFGNDNFQPQPRPSARKGRKPGQDIGEDFEFSDILPLPEESEMIFKLDESGVFQVYENQKSAEMETPILAIPTIRDFYMDLDAILYISSEGPTKSFAFRRLQYLEGKFNLYFLLHEYQEIAETKRVPHRDFYNVRKVDTHVHHSSCMNQKHLLRFIKSKMKKCPEEVVMYGDGKHLTLREVFDSIHLTAYDLSIDTLDMHVSFHSNTSFLVKEI